MNPPPVPKHNGVGFSTAPPPVPVPPRTFRMNPPSPSVEPDMRAPIAPRVEISHEVAAGRSAEKAGRSSVMVWSDNSEERNQIPGDKRKPLRNGTVVGQYLIVSLLGKGGFGLTYSAICQKTNEQVVLKEHMPAGVAERDANGIFVASPTQEAEEHFQTTLNEFREEITVLMALEHPGIVRIIEAFEANGTAYYVMPRVQGSPMELSPRMDMDRASLFREARRIKQQLMGMLNALSYLDQNNVVHRDLKPENVLITPEGQPILLDFGSARQMQAGKEYSNVFTPAFCAPEQSVSPNNEQWGRLRMGPWTDIYSLGACFYYRITRMLPPEAETRIISLPNDPYRPLQKRADLVELYGENFIKALDKALMLAPEDRWQHALDWRMYIERGILPDSKWKFRHVLPYITTLLFAAVALVLLALNVRQKEERDLLYDGSLNFASSLMSDFYADMSDLPGSTTVQSRFCKYLQSYMEIMQDSLMHKDARYRATVAVANLNIGMYYATHGANGMAIMCFRRAEGEVQKLVEAYPEETRYRYTLAQIYIQHAKADHRQSNDDEEARKLLAESTKILHHLCEVAPQSPDYASMLCESLIMDLRIRSNNGTLSDIRSDMQGLMDILHRTLEDYPNHQGALQQYAEALHLEGRLALEESRISDTEKCYTEELELYGRLLEKCPYKLSYKEGLAKATYSLGLVYARHAMFSDSDKWAYYIDKAAETYKNHVNICQELERLDAERPQFIYDECCSLIALHDIKFKQKQMSMANSYATKLMRKTKQLLQLSPDDGNYLCMQAEAWCAMASVHGASSRTVHLAQEEFEKARSIAEDLLQHDPKNTRFANSYLHILMSAAGFAEQRDDIPAAESMLGKANETLDTLHAAYPDNKVYNLYHQEVEERLKALPREEK